MDRTLIQDIKTALSNMWNVTRDFLMNGLQVALLVLTFSAAIGTLGYCLATWPWHTASVIVVVMIVCWFFMELDSARGIREYEEQHLGGTNK